jgi:hypothetical protein
MSLPWIVAAIALVSLIALVAGQRFAANRQESAALPAAPEVSAEGLPQGARAPDISQLSPSERAMRLYDRLMTYQEQGKLDSLRFFAPMAIAAYGMLGDLDLDGHYDLGRIGEITGDTKLAAAEADTILKQDRDHLLGLTLAAHAARLQGRTADERSFFQRLVAAEPSERKKALPEYTTHERDITSGLEEARRVIRR